MIYWTSSKLNQLPTVNKKANDSNANDRKLAKNELPTQGVESVIMKKVSINMRDGVFKKFERVKDLLTHAACGQSFEGVIERLCDVYLDKHCPQKRDARRKKRNDNNNRKTSTKNVSIAVRDAVFKDGNCTCSYVAPDGTKCNKTAHLEVEHCYPKALGGSNSIDNLRVLCKSVFKNSLGSLEFLLLLQSSNDNSCKKP